MPLSFIAKAFDEVSAEALRSESDHRIANNLSLIASFLRLEASNLPKDATFSSDEVRLLLREVGARIDAISRLHSLLARNERGEIDLCDYLGNVATTTLSTLASDGKWTLSVEMPEPVPISGKKAVAIGLIVQEAIANALKYAHPSGVDGTLAVRCWSDDDKEALTIEIADDGIGLPEGFDPKAGGSLGLSVIRGLGSQLEATVDLDDSAGIGLTLRLRVPRSGMAFSPASFRDRAPDPGASGRNPANS